MLYCTKIYPYGKYKLPEGENVDDEMREVNFNQEHLEEVDEETYKVPTHADLVNLKIWVHEWSGLLKEGRRVHLKPEGEDLDDEKVDEIMRIKRIKDPYPKRLAPILGDSPVEGLPFAWNMKHYGD